MKFSKVLAIIMVVALAFSAMAMTASAKGALVLEVTGDEMNTFANDSDGGTDNLQNAGGGERAYNADKGIIVMNRSNDYDSVDLKAAGLADGKYVVEVTFATETASVFRIANGASPYGNILDSAAATTGETLSVEIEVAGGKWKTVLLDGTESEQERIRFQTNADVIADYSIKSIQIFDAAGAAADVTTAAATGDTSAATDADKGAETGVEGVAAIAGLAIIATGAVVISRKRK